LSFRYTQGETPSVSQNFFLANSSGFDFTGCVDLNATLANLFLPAILAEDIFQELNDKP